MSSVKLIAILLLICLGFYFFARQRFALIAQADAVSKRPYSLPKYYGYYAALCCGIPAIIVLALWQAIAPAIIEGSISDLIPQEIIAQGESATQLYLNEVINLSGQNFSSPNDKTKADLANRYNQVVASAEQYKIVLVLTVAVAIAYLMQRQMTAQFPARQYVEKILMGFLILCSSIAILTTIGIVFSVLFESSRFFGKVPPTEFLFGTEWSPQTALRTDQVASEGSFGAIPLFLGTLLISAIALLVAVPLGLYSAIYLSEYASAKTRAICKPLLELLAGIPTVVYGFFAALTIAPLIRNAGESIGLSVASESALAAGLVMGVMIIPFVSSLSDDVISAVPQALRDGAYGLGSTKSETIRQVVMPAALPGVVSAVLLAASRAIGETMIVVMAAGLAANMTIDPLKAVTTVTVQIVTLLTGDQEFDSAKTLAAFALGLMLFITTLALNIFALHIARKYREQYD